MSEKRREEGKENRKDVENTNHLFQPRGMTLAGDRWSLSPARLAAGVRSALQAGIITRRLNTSRWCGKLKIHDIHSILKSLNFELYHNKTMTPIAVRSLRGHLIARSLLHYATSSSSRTPRIFQPAIRNGYCSSCTGKVDSKPESPPHEKLIQNEGNTLKVDENGISEHTTTGKVQIAPASTGTVGQIIANDSPTTEVQNTERDTTTDSPPVPPADHRQIGVEQDLFFSSKYSPGSPLFLPNGAFIFNKLVSFLRAQYSQFGFEEVITPTIYKKSLWEKSGHLENYADDMFSVTGRGASGETEGKELGEDEAFGLKPMNCPGHCLIFAAQKRSYRDLPIRYADFSALHRNEISGALSGLTRVRRFHQDDGHIFCRPSQVGPEIQKTLEFVKLVYGTFNLGPFQLVLSTRPKDNFIGTEEEWDRAESTLRDVLDGSGEEWSVNEGDGAFYGPKIDIILKDSDNKEHQTATIQLDFQLPKRFDLQYDAPAPEFEQQGLTTDDPELLAISGPVQPVMIHRAVLGSLERFFALITEHYSGHWPFWLNPHQVEILTINDSPELLVYTQYAVTRLQYNAFEYFKVARQSLPASISRTRLRLHVDSRPVSIGKKISEAKRKGAGVLVVIGMQNVANQTVTADLSAISSHHVKTRLFQYLRSKKDPLAAKIPRDRGELPLGDEFKVVNIHPDVLRSLLVLLDGLYAH